MSRADRHDPDTPELDELTREILKGAHSEDGALRAFQRAFDDKVPLPADAFVIGEPVSVVGIEYEGNRRRGLAAKCRREDGSVYTIGMPDVVFPESTVGALHVAAYRTWIGIQPYADRPAQKDRPRHHKASLEDLAVDGPIDLVVLSVGQTAARCRLLASDRAITLRFSGLLDAVPSEIVTVRPRTQWRYAGHPHMSGDIVGRRLDVKALGLVSLKLSLERNWNPAEEHWGEEDEPIEEWARSIISRGPRPEFEMEQILPGENPENPDIDPILDSNDLKESGDFLGARKIPMDLCQADLRCLDAHTHLGSLIFDRNPENAVRYYEAGERIGELSLGEGFDGVQPWGLIDNQGARNLLADVRAGKTWESSSHR
jgi:hypothetical protein